MIGFLNSIWNAILVIRGYFLVQENEPERSLLRNRNRRSSIEDLSHEMSDGTGSPSTSSGLREALTQHFETDDEDEEFLSPNVSFKFGLEQGILNYLFYITLVQPILKVILCVIVITIDIQLDNNCRDEMTCPKPIYTKKRAAYFMVAISTLCVSVCHFGVGSYMFTKYRSLTADNTRGPMFVFATILCMEIFIFIVAAFSAQFTPEFSSSYGIVILSEFLAVFAGLCLPVRHHQQDNEKRTMVWKVDEDVAETAEEFV